MIKSKNTKDGYYSLDPIKSVNADINIIFGERSNGKTYALNQQVIADKLKKNRPSAYLRRMDESLRPKLHKDHFKENVKNGDLKKKYDNLILRSGSWYGCHDDRSSGRLVHNFDSNDLFMITRSLNTDETGKGSLPDMNIANIIFDEMISRHGYLMNEFVVFMNMLSTIIRDTKDTKVWLLGNTVNWECPYFSEMGLKHVDKMEQGTIDLYEMANKNGDNLKIAVEYTLESTRESKKSNSKFYSFDNPELDMIVGGKWEIGNYQHPRKTSEDDKLFLPKIIGRNIYFSVSDHIVCCEVRKNKELGLYCIVRPYYREIDEKMKRIYTDSDILDSRYRKSLYQQDKIDSLIIDLYKSDKFYYTSNEVGEIVRNCMMKLSDNMKKF